MKAERPIVFAFACALALVGVVCGKLGGKGGGDDNLPTSGIIPFSEIEQDETFRFTGPAVTLEGATQIGGAAVLAVDGRYRMWFAATRDGETAIYVATSDDGLRFVAEPTPLLRPSADWHGTSLAAPSIVRRSGGFELYLEANDGTAIARASSLDGTAFVLEPAPVLSPGLDWEEGRVASPSAVLDGERLLLFYEGGQGKGIGLALSEGGAAFVKSPQPLLAPSGDEGRWDTTFIGTPRVIRVVQVTGRPIFRLYFAGGKDARRSIGYAGSFDGLQFSPFVENPIFVPRENVIEPCVIPFQSGFMMYFNRISGSRTGIFLAGHRLRGPYGPAESDASDGD
ncbi:MAG: hypothetical protein KC609_25455 [Myxococcales bacterium]|nr:hypothetical protein [Myxococcales bacterium]